MTKLTFVFHEALSILRLAHLVHQVLGLLLGQLLAQVDQQLEEVVGLAGVVILFVVELQDLHEVVEATGVLGVLNVLVHFEEVGLLDELLFLLLGASDTLDHSQGGVYVGGAEDVTDVEGVNLAIALEVVDIKGKIDGVDLLLLESKSFLKRHNFVTGKVFYNVYS